MNEAFKRLPPTLASVRARIEHLRADLRKQRRVRHNARVPAIPPDAPLPTADLCPLVRVHGVRVVDGATVVTLSCGHELIPKGGDLSEPGWLGERYRCRRCGRGDVVPRQGRLFS